MGKLISPSVMKPGQVLETGGGLKKASGYFDYGSFVLMNVDILTDLDLEAMIVLS